MATQDEPARQYNADRFTDPDAVALLEILRDDLIGKFGEGAVSNVYDYDVPADKLRRWPCLVVARQSDRSQMNEDGGTETTGWLIRYVAPMTPLERLGQRWAVLRAMFQRMRVVLGASQSPFYNDGRVAATVRGLGEWRNFDATYQTLDTNAGMVPVVSIRATAIREIMLDYSDLDDLQPLVGVDFHVNADVQDGTGPEKVQDRTIES